MAGRPGGRAPSDDRAARRDERCPGDRRGVRNARCEPRGPAARLVFDLLDADPSLLTTEQSFWDSLAAVATLDPAVVTTRPATVRVVLGTGRALGRLVEDPAGAVVTLATKADADRFASGFISVLNGGAAVQPSPRPSVELAVQFDGTTCRTILPATIPTGFVSIEIDNRGSSAAGAGLFILGAGLTVDQVLAAAASGSQQLATMGRIAAAAGVGVHRLHPVHRAAAAPVGRFGDHHAVARRPPDGGPSSRSRSEFRIRADSDGVDTPTIVAWDAAGTGSAGIEKPRRAAGLLRFAIELVEMGESRTPRPEPFAGDHYERVRWFVVDRPDGHRHSAGRSSHVPLDRA